MPVLIMIRRVKTAALVHQNSVRKETGDTLAEAVVAFAHGHRADKEKMAAEISMKMQPESVVAAVAVHPSGRMQPAAVLASTAFSSSESIKR